MSSAVTVPSASTSGIISCDDVHPRRRRRTRRGPSGPAARSTSSSARPRPPSSRARSQHAQLGLAREPVPGLALEGRSSPHASISAASAVAWASTCSSENVIAKRPGRRRDPAAAARDLLVGHPLVSFCSYSSGPASRRTAGGCGSRRTPGSPRSPRRRSCQLARADSARSAAIIGRPRRRDPAGGEASARRAPRRADAAGRSLRRAQDLRRAGAIDPPTDLAALTRHVRLGVEHRHRLTPCTSRAVSSAPS